MMNLEAIEMLRVRTGTVPVWMVRLTVRFQRGGRPAPRVERIECMAERLRRSEGVSAAAVVPGPEGLAAVVGVHARDGAIATERARALVAAAAAGSGIDGVMVHRAGLPVRAAERR